jgi:protein-S-isoprenylcysteine O-methyltransferase Ste14
VWANLILWSGAAWWAWLIVWLALPRAGARDERRESGGSRAVHLSLLTIAFVAVYAPVGPRFDAGRSVERLGIAVSLAGFAIMIWARLHLGTAWSGRITVGEDQRVVRSGPYRLVRHPIYSGFLLAFLGSVLVAHSPAAIAGLAVCIGTYARKIVVEERLLAATLGDAYARYQREVKAIIPFFI